MFYMRLCWSPLFQLKATQIMWTPPNGLLSESYTNFEGALPRVMTIIYWFNEVIWPCLVVTFPFLHIFASCILHYIATFPAKFCQFSMPSACCHAATIAIRLIGWLWRQHWLHRFPSHGRLPSLHRHLCSPLCSKQGNGRR